MFSVLLPVYNHADFVLEAVDSALSSALVTEVLVVDDGSSDASAEVLRYISRDRRVINLTDDPPVNRGAHHRLNQLAEAASNEWLAVLNSDDRFVPGRFELCRDLIRLRHPDLILGHMLLVGQDGTMLGTKRGVVEPEYPYPAELDLKSHFNAGDVLTLLASQNFAATTSNMVFRKSLFRTIGGFADLRYAHDYDFVLRAAVLGRCLYTTHFLTMYRIHATNTIRETGSRSKVIAEVQWILQRLLNDFPYLREQEVFMKVMRARPAEQHFELVQ